MTPVARSSTQLGLPSLSRGAESNASTHFGLPSPNPDATSHGIRPGSASGRDARRGPSAGDATIAPGRPFAAFAEEEDSSPAPGARPVFGRSEETPRLEPLPEPRRTSLGLRLSDITEAAEARRAVSAEPPAEPRRTQFSLPVPRIGGETSSGGGRPAPLVPPRRTDGLSPRSTSAGFQRSDGSERTGSFTMPVPRLADLSEPAPVADGPREDSGLFRLPTRRTLEIRAPIARGTMVGMRSIDAQDLNDAAGKYRLHGVAVGAAEDDGLGEFDVDIDLSDPEPEPEPEPVRPPAIGRSGTMLHMGAIRIDPATGRAVAPSPAGMGAPGSAPEAVAAAAPVAPVAQDADLGWGSDGLDDIFGADFDQALQSVLDDSLQKKGRSGATPALSRSAEADAASGLSRSDVGQDAREPKAPASGIFRAARARRKPELEVPDGLGQSANVVETAEAPGAEVRKQATSGMYSDRKLVRSAETDSSGEERPGSGIMKAVRRRTTEPSEGSGEESARPRSTSVAPGSGILRGARGQQGATDGLAIPDAAAVLADTVEPKSAPKAAEAVAPVAEPRDAAPREPADKPVAEVEPVAPAGLANAPAALPSSGTAVRLAAMMSGLLLIGSTLIPVGGKIGLMTGLEAGGAAAVASVFPAIAGLVALVVGALSLPPRMQSLALGLIGVLVSCTTLFAGDFGLGAGFTATHWAAGSMGVLLPIGLVWKGRYADSLGGRLTIGLGMIAVVGAYLLLKDATGAPALFAYIDGLSTDAAVYGLALLPLGLLLPSVLPLLTRRLSGLGTPLAGLFAASVLVMGAGLAALTGDLMGGFGLGLLAAGSMAAVSFGLGDALGQVFDAKR